MYYIVHSATHNPWTFVVDLGTTRSLLTASERSTAIGMTTGIIGATWEEEKEDRNAICSKVSS